MTAEEVIDFFSPEESTTVAVMDWLVESGISADRFALSVNKQVLEIFPSINCSMPTASV
jgi:tripeptidyl-peptidase-1